MKYHLILPVVAGVLVVFATSHALYTQRHEPAQPPPVPPPTTPFGETVAGAGMVEPATEASGTSAIAVGSQVSGVITRVAVKIGQEVKAGELLFELDRRSAEANLAAGRAALAVAQAQLRKLEMQPRSEELPVYEAQLQVAEANLRQARDLRDRDQALTVSGAVADQDRIAHEQAYQAAIAQRALARANLNLEKAGAWQPDKDIAYATVQQARAQLGQAETALELLAVRAPVAGTVLQISIRPGEFVPTGGGQSLIVMGNLRPLHVRVNIDEEDIPRLLLNGPARAKLRGDLAQQEIPLRFVRLEPYVVPKTSLTGQNTERVDTRVVQVIYAMDPGHELVRQKKVLAGQLVDVFIDARR